MKLNKILSRILKNTKASVVKQVRAELAKLAKAEEDSQAIALRISLGIDLGELDAVIDATPDQLDLIFADTGGMALAQLGVADRMSLVDQVNDAAVAYARERAAELVGKRVLSDGSIVDNPNAEWRIDEPTREAIRRTIADGLEENIGSDGIIDNLQADYAFSEDRAELIARTEIAEANSQGALGGYKAARDIGVSVKKLWQADDGACDICLENEAAGAIDLDDDFPSGDDAPTAHPNCFIGETKVCAFGVEKSLKRWFEGEIVVIGIAENGDISITPNHPILTNRGWIAAGDLKIGDLLAKCINPPIVALLVEPNDHYIETRIDNISDALLVAGGMAAGSVPTAAEDFHGDGIVDGKVDIVNSASALSGNISQARYGTENTLLVDGHSDRAELAGGGALFALGDASLPSANSRMSRSRLSASLFGSESGVHKSSGIAVASDGIPRTAESLSQGEIVNTRHNGQLDTALASLIKFVEVLNLSRRNFAGHVYNLSTGNGWYIAENIVVSNCECALVPIVEDAQGNEEEGDEE